MILVESTAKHLGHTLCNNLNIYDFNDTLHEMKVKSNTISNSLSCICEVFRRLIFNSQCMRLYGCELYGTYS